MLTLLLCVYGLLLVILTSILFPMFGAIGAASAYAVSVGLFSLTTVYCAAERVKSLRMC